MKKLINNLLKKRGKQIAILGPLGLPIPPKKQGGIEWMVYYLAEGLVKKGHKVLLFAPKGTQTSAKLVPVCEKPIAQYNISKYAEASRRLRMELSILTKMRIELMKRKNSISIIFNHTVNGGMFADLEKTLRIPTYHILHLPLYEHSADVYKKFNSRLIAISNSQKKAFPDLHYSTTIYNGIDLQKFQFKEKPKDYFIFAGKMRSSKNPLTAIEATKLAKEKLIMVGKISDKKYFEKQIKVLIKDKIKYQGEVSFNQIKQLYGGAKALLFPIKWEEPFGLVMIEAMACGTPVIAFDKGSVREVVEHNKTGFIVKNTSQMATAMKKINKLNRQDCRKSIEKNFSVKRMIDEYEKVYLKSLKR